MIKEMKQLNDAKDKITFQKVCEEWLLYKKYEIKESTYRLYQYRIRKYLIEVFKEKDLIRSNKNEERIKKIYREK